MTRKASGVTVSEKLPAGIKSKLRALEDVAGLLSDLPPEELEIFLEAAKRRPLFGAKSPE